MVGIIERLIHEEAGQGMVEYVMIFMVIVIVCMFGYKFFGEALSIKVNDIGSKI